VGTVVWLASELMFFSGLFAAYFTLRAGNDGPWPPEGVELETGVAAAFTALLVLSSVTMQLAIHHLGHARVQQFRQWTLVTAVLALIFLLNQAREWATVDFSPDSHPFGSAFFVMTGFHGLHVLGGVVAMVVMLGRSALPGFGRGDLPSADVVSYYWHFVDVVWIALFATLFFVR
jgi:cytochrome c oxidase subunit 3